MTGDSIAEQFIKANVALLVDHPFFGDLALRLKHVDATEWTATAATDGRHLFYNRDFVASLTKKQLIFVIVHEILHVALDHIGRRGHRLKKPWGMAIDYAANAILIEEKIGKMPEQVVVTDRHTNKLVERIGLFEEKYRGMAAEEIYEDIMANSVEIVLTLDDHLDAEGEEGTMGVRVFGEHGPPVLSEDDLEQIRQDMRSAMLGAIQTAGTNLSRGLQRLVNDVTQPKLNWRQMLTITVQSVHRRDYTYLKLSRKGFSSGFILPGLRHNQVRVAAGIDVSGSITEEMLRDFLGEVAGLMRQFDDFTLDVWCFDTEIHNHQTFTPENASDIETYEVRGGGGTLFEPNWTFMQHNNIEPSYFIMFTDGKPAQSWGEDGYCETIFVIAGNTRISAPFGITAYYDET